MKNILKSLWIFFCIILLIIYTVSCFSTYIAPSVFSYSGILALAFPYLFLLMVLSGIVNLFILRKMGILLLLFLLLGYKNVTNSFAFHSGKWSVSKDSTTLRIMTWNVEGFSNSSRSNTKTVRRINMLQTIQQLHPDILCLQQFYNVENGKRITSVRRELDSLGYKYSYFSNDIYKQLKNGSIHTHGSAIFSTIPIFDTGKINIINNNNYENMIYADVKLNNKPLRIFTAHLQSFSLYTDTAYAQDEEKNIFRKTYDRKHSIIEKMKEIEVTHEKEISIIRSAINSSPNSVIYCGDMNTTPASYNYRILKANLQDAFLEKGSGLGTTFYKVLPTLRIDYCFVDDKLKVEQCKVENKKLSDHYPVITDVRWK